MSEVEVCTICLDTLFPDRSSLITRIQPCGHFYHSNCIDSWKERSNTCPTCRKDYDIAEDIDKFGTVVSVNSVTKLIIIPLNHDEFFENISDIEEELPEDRIGRRINRLVSRSNVCILCDERRGNVTTCNGCSSSFHYSCLGLNVTEFWCCPMCDSEQRLMDRPSRFRRSRNSEITNRVYNQHRDLVMPVNNEEISDVPAMTVDEQQSWETFELARSEMNNDIEINREQDSNVRKLKKPSSRNKKKNLENLPPIKISNNNNSLVNKILGEMKENRGKIKVSEFPKSEATRAEVEQITPKMSPTLTYSSASSPNSIEDELNYETKLMLQGIVRSKLKPIYERKEISDEEYTNINKKVSHILYNFFINDINQNFESIAAFHVNQEIMDL